MKFNGQSKEYINVLYDLLRPPSPPIEFNTIEKYSGGSRKKSKRFKDLELNVPFKINTGIFTNAEVAKEEMMDWLIEEEPKKLEFNDRPDRYYLAEYKEMQINEQIDFDNGIYIKGIIVFYLAEPYRFGSNNEINVTTSNSSFNILGQVKPFWKSETILSSDTNQFVLEGTNFKIILNYDFKSGDRITIDSRKREVLLFNDDITNTVSLETEWNKGKLELNTITARASQNTKITYDEIYY